MENNETKHADDHTNEINLNPDLDHENEKNRFDHNLTISTKLSTEKLICKSDNSPPSISASQQNLANTFDSGRHPILYEHLKPPHNSTNGSKRRTHQLLVYLGLLQLLFGIFMIIFGLLVRKADAALSQVSQVVF